VSDDLEPIVVHEKKPESESKEVEVLPAQQMDLTKPGRYLITNEVIESTPLRYFERLADRMEQLRQENPGLVFDAASIPQGVVVKWEFRI
jgi:hypothetical protein